MRDENDFLLDKQKHKAKALRGAKLVFVTIRQLVWRALIESFSVSESYNDLVLT